MHSKINIFSLFDQILLLQNRTINGTLYVMSKQAVKDIFEVSLKVDSSNNGNSEILKEFLGEIGIDGISIVEYEIWPNTYLSLYFQSQERARALRKKLRAYHLNNVSVNLKRLRKDDWQTKWKKGFKPFVLTKSFGVVPMRLKKKYRFRRRKPLYIDTDLAFGTGLHATTRFMARFVERCTGRFSSFLDIGTGTGILAMIAAKCHASDITAIDICPRAVAVAKSNCIANECASINIKELDARKIKSKKRYDFVCANIITQDLIGMAEKIISLVKPGQYLAVSGISLNSYDCFRQAYAKYPLRCVKIEKGEGWVAILYKKLLETRRSK